MPDKFDYHFKNRITHPDKLVANKANYFADCFDFVCANIGRLNSFQLENHKSLVQKIEFQLTHFTSHSPKYLNHYFANKYLSQKDGMIKEHYLVEWKEITRLRLASKNFSIEDKRNTLHQKIKTLSAELEDTLFKNTLDGIILAIQCRHPLNKHNHVFIFDYLTPILVCEFAFSGFHLPELNSLFKLIFERDISIEQNRVITKAPLPSALLHLKSEPEKFFSAAKDYLDKRTLKQQFEGIYHLFKNSLGEKTLIFPLNNAQTYIPIKLEYEGAKIVNRLSKVYVKNRNNKAYYSFFTKKKKLFIETIVIAGDEVTALRHAIRKSNAALNFVNSQLKLNISLDTTDYVYCEDGVCTRKRKFPDIIRNSTKKSFRINDVKNYLKKESALKNRIVSADKIYHQAIAAFSDEDKLVHLWRYLESFFDHDDYKAADIIDKVSKILSRFSNHNFAFNSFNYIVQVIYNSGAGIESERFGVSREELWNLLHPDYYVNADFKRCAEIIKHPFVTKQIRLQLDNSAEVKAEIASKFYSNLLFETYEQRNLLEHSATFHDRSVQKIILSLPDAVKQFRNIMIESVRATKHRNFNEVIDRLFLGELDDLFAPKQKKDLHITKKKNDS